MRLEIVRADITSLGVDAIVSAANRSLLGGGGVDGAIHRAAGPRLLEVCREIGGCDPRDAKITGAFDLPCRHVIHTVGPIWRGGDQGEPEILARCYRRSMELADENGCGSVAFPAISTGAYGFPHDLASQTAVTCLQSVSVTYPDMHVMLVAFDARAERHLRRAMRAGPTDE